MSKVLRRTRSPLGKIGIGFSIHEPRLPHLPTRPGSCVRESVSPPPKETVASSSAADRLTNNKIAGQRTFPDRLWFTVDQGLLQRTPCVGLAPPVSAPGSARHMSRRRGQWWRKRPDRR